MIRQCKLITKDNKKQNPDIILLTLLKTNYHKNVLIILPTYIIQIIQRETRKRVFKT